MKISEKTIKTLQEVINGDELEFTVYRTKRALVDLFNNFGRNDVLEDSTARRDYTRNCIRSFNGGPTLRKIIETVVDPRHYIIPEKETYQRDAATEPSKLSLEKTVAHLNDSLVNDGFTLKKESGKDTYKIAQSDGGIIPAEKISTLSHEFIADQVRKAEDKLSQSDYDGAITNARSLVEAFQEKIIRKSGAEVPKYDGDMQKLYKATKQALNLDPSQKDLSDTLKQILSGLNSLVSGISGLSNKMADRHSRSYKPARHHAKLAVNVAFTFCEFLLDSYEYQQSQKHIRSKR